MYDLDVHAQVAAAKKEAAEKEAAEEEGAKEECAEKEADNVEEEPQVVTNDEVEKLKKDMLDLQEGMLKMNKSMEDGFEKLINLIGGQDTRLKEVESFVKSQTYDSRFDPIYCSGGGGTTGGYGGTTAGDGGTTGGHGGTNGGHHGLETPTVAGGGDGLESPKNAQLEPSEGEGSKDSEEEGSKDSEEEGDEDIEEEGEEGKKDEVVGHKRMRKPSDAKKSPYTTMTEEKKRKKAKSKKD